MQSVANATWIFRRNAARSYSRRYGLLPIIASAIVGAVVAVVTMQVTKREDISSDYGDRLTALQNQIDALAKCTRDVERIHWDFMSSMHADLGWLIFKDESTNLALYELAKSQSLESLVVEFLASLEGDQYKSMRESAEDVGRRSEQLRGFMEGIIENRSEHMRRKDQTKFTPPSAIAEELWNSLNAAAE